MALSASGQWLVDAGMRMMSRADQDAWQQWTQDAGWSPKDRDPKHLPADIAILAAKALEALMNVLSEDARLGRGSGDAELFRWNDIETAKAARDALEADIRQH